MQSSGNLSSLAERMKARTERERQEVEALTRQQFEALRENLSASSKNALTTTEAAIMRQLKDLEKTVSSLCRTLSWMFARKWLQALLITLSTLIGVALAGWAIGWGLLTLAENKITDVQREINTLNQQKSALEKTVTQLEVKTWGVRLVEAPEGRFIVLPPKNTLKPGWNIDNKPAWKVE